MLQTPPVGRAVRHCSALLHRKQSVVCRLLFSRAGGPDQSPGGYFLDEFRSWSKSGKQEPVVLPWCEFCGGDWETDVRTAAGRWASPVPLARPICDQIFLGQRRRARQNWWFSGDAACFCLTRFRTLSGNIGRARGPGFSACVCVWVRDATFRKMTNQNQTDTNEMATTETKYRTDLHSAEKYEY